MNDIVERLRQIPRFADFNAPPLIEHEAADEIERLRAENERLREALEKISTQKKTNELDTEYDVEFADFEDGYDMCIDTARAALGEEKK
jgi:regulator of replication initiation timing